MWPITPTGWPLEFCRPMNRGLLYAIGAYTLWGLLPIYWKALHAVPATEIVSHRMAWSLLFVLALLALKQRWAWLGAVSRQPKTLLIVFLAGCILAANWLTYVWGVNAGYVVETSLGYFINPLVSVLMGVIFLRERLRGWQWLAIGFALVGVLYLTLRYGTLPWIALVLALSFALYGLLKKATPLNALEGLSLETALMFPPAFGYLLFLELNGSGSLGHANPTITLLLVLTGVATGVPLLMFSAAARRIPLSMLGILQYIAPTFQFLLGVYLYHEPFDQSRLIGFGLIWTALLIYSVEGFLARRGQLRYRYSTQPAEISHVDMVAAPKPDRH
ncbi:MAG: Protein RarD [Anaerolineae bacterium]|nr:Protein RarD [Anaerolineae bacterium]